MDNIIKVILKNTPHTIYTLSEILEISPYKLRNAHKMNNQEMKRLDMLKQMMASHNVKYA